MALSLTILQHTPWWVFAVLAVLIVTGVQAMRQRVVPVWRLLIVPAIFIGWGVLSVVQRSAAAPVLALDWIAAAAIGAAIGLASTRLGAFSFAAGGRAVRVPGTPIPLVRSAAIFVTKYGLAVAVAFAATAPERAQLVVWDVAVSGLAAGYFIGWLARFAPALRASATPQTVRPVPGT
jgi:hypothetical protein